MADLNAKPWFYSRTIWGVIVMAAAGAAQQFGLAEITPEAQAAVVDWIINVVGVGAAGMAIWGRVSADRKIG